MPGVPTSWTRRADRRERRLPGRRRLAHQLLQVGRQGREARPAGAYAQGPPPAGDADALTAEEVSTVLATAVARATLGARQLVDHVAAAGVHRSASGIQKVLRRHNLATRRQRIAALASLTAAESGQLTDAALEGPFGFCLAATDPGQLVCLDTFYVGRLKGVGAVYQLTAIDLATRWLVVRLIVGDKSAQVAAGFLDQVQAALGEIDVELAGVLSDNGPEFTGRAFRDHAAEIGVAHHRIPPRRPNHNGVCERVQGTVLQEFYRPFFHRGRVDRIADLDAALQTWVGDYNTRRRNHGDYMRGRNPRQVLDAITARNALCQAAGRQRSRRPHLSPRPVSWKV